MSPDTLQELTEGVFTAATVFVFGVSILGLSLLFAFIREAARDARQRALGRRG